MLIENNELAIEKASSQQDDAENAANALREDAFGSEEMDESRRLHHQRRRSHNGEGWPGRSHYERPTSKVSALQYQVRDGKITVISR